jgi:molybdopterin-guanine dinucleotide biosynthesis protein A
MKTAGFVLTGGESSRMGRDKALLPAGNSVMVESIASTLATVTEEVFLVGRPERYSGLAFECLPDLRPGLGPLSGLETVLASHRAELNVVVACDLAGLRASWITGLLQAMKPEALCAAVLDRNAKLQPLCAVYRTECLERVTNAINEGRLRAIHLLAELKAVKVSVDDVILNMNTPEEFERWATSR